MRDGAQRHLRRGFPRVLIRVPTWTRAAGCVGCFGSRKVNHILDADVRDFFGSVNHDWLIRFLEHRVGDKRIIRLIRKWLKAGILEDGVVTVADSGTGQGSVRRRAWTASLRAR